MDQSMNGKPEANSPANAPTNVPPKVEETAVMATPATPPQKGKRKAEETYAPEANAKRRILCGAIYARDPDVGKMHQRITELGKLVVDAAFKAEGEDRRIAVNQLTAALHCAVDVLGAYAAQMNRNGPPTVANRLATSPIKAPAPAATSSAANKPTTKQ